MMFRLLFVGIVDGLSRLPGLIARILPLLFTGPTEESNWVIPGRILVGAYPSALEDKLNNEILLSILRLGTPVRETLARAAPAIIKCVAFLSAGVTTFVCLQQGTGLCLLDFRWLLRFLA